MNQQGMSRAAKKRAKKKQKKRHIGQQENGGGETSSTKDTIDEPQVPSKKTKREDPKEPQKLTEEPCTLQDDDEVHSSDEEVAMKVPAAAPPPDIAELPAGCTTLKEILLLDADDTSEVTVAFRRMTCRQRAHCALQFLLQPASISVAHFYDKYWEKKPLLIQGGRNDDDDVTAYRSRLDGFLSLNSIRSITQKMTLFYGKDLNVTRYEKSRRDGVYRRVTLDKVVAKTTANKDHTDSSAMEDPAPSFVAVDSKELWKHWDDGCTVRLLCPHQHSGTIHALLSLLELEWGCMVGANAYLTPAANSSQGFAPHYDDIEAFILQLQGQKRWRVYAPLCPAERLPRTSSRDYVDSDLENVEPVMDVVLKPGDALYMPRGWIHQACTLEQQDDNNSDYQNSLHLTVSAMQQWAWADLLEVVMPEALNAAINSETSTSLRTGLPPRFLEYMGAMHDNREENVPEVLKRQSKDSENDDNSSSTGRQEDEQNTQRLQEEFRAEAKKRIMRVAKEAIDMLDAACDQMGKRFLSDRLPPALTAAEESETSQGALEKVHILPNFLCRLVRPGIARLVLEDDKAVLYHCMDNSIVYHENPVSPMEFELDDAPAIEQLLTTTEPHWIGVADLIHDSIEDKVGVAQALYDEGILAVRGMMDLGG